MTPEERARQLENQERLRRIVERRLAEEAARGPAAPKDARS
jgi:hypothetical protein